jgi:hypothetical protein
MAREGNGGPSLMWEGADLPRVTPGDYQAAFAGWQGPVWVRAFRRWSIRLEFCLIGEGSLVSAFFNLESDPAKPHIGRRSRFYKVWCLANGEAPRRGQQMTPETFAESGLLYVVRVEDSLKDEKENEKPDALRYSRVTDVLRVERATI